MATNPIQWFPGHMAKTRRMMKECLGEVDIILELLDARIPYSSKNPEIEKLIGDKPRITILTKSTLADPEMSKRWVEKLNKGSTRAVIITLHRLWSRAPLAIRIQVVPTFCSLSMR